MTYFSGNSIKEGFERPPNLHGDVLTDYLTMLYEPSIPPHALTLKVGAICTIARNLSMECCWNYKFVSLFSLWIAYGSAYKASYNP